MSKITVLQMPSFKKSYKKLHSKDKTKVDQAIHQIIENPQIGQEKRGNLAGVYVYKFKIHDCENLLAYQWCPKERILLALGVHENFYRNLKK